MLLDLDAGSPGDWLAAVGITIWHPGRWVHHGGLCRYLPISYETNGLPTVDELAVTLDQLPVRDSRWLNHRGQATVAKTARKLRTALLDVDQPVVIGDNEPRTEVGGGWEIDDTWLRPPAAYDQPDPGRPLFRTALALVGAHRAADWTGHWPTGTTAVGHLWDGDPDEHKMDGPVVMWRRQPRPANPTPGPLGACDLVQLSPSWQMQVRWQVGGLPQDAETLVGPSEIAKRLHVRPATVYQWRQRGVLPDPARMIGKRPAWLWATIAQWAVDTDRL